MGGFVYDDNLQIIRNPWIRDLDNIPKLFVSSTMSFLNGQPANTYRPVFYLVYMAEYLTFGLRPWAWHLVNILLHSMNALMVYFLASLFITTEKKPRADNRGPLALTMTAPFIAGLVFALHPINSEVVSWAGTIPELIFTLLVLCAFTLYILAERAPQRAAAYLACSAACFSVALFSKETAMALIIIIPLYEFTKRGWQSLRRWKIFIIYLIPAVIYMVMRTSALGGMTQMSLIKMTFYEGLLNVFPLIARYLGKLILPINLSIIYSFTPVHSAFEMMFIIGLIACAAFAALILLLRKKRKEIFFLIWILIPLLPVLYMPILSVGGFADRYLYLSTAGAAVFIALMVSRMYKRQQSSKRQKTILIATLTLILVIYSAASIKRAIIWRSDYSLWSDTVIKSPKSPNALYNLGWALQSRGGTENLKKALKVYKETIRVKPNKENAHYNAALIYQKMGDYPNALIHYRASLRLKPSNATTPYNIAMLYQSMGDISMAIKFYNLAISINPQYEDAHYNLGWTYQKMGDYSNALIHLKEVLRLNPRSTDAHYMIGNIYDNRGEREKALSEFSKAVTADPSYGPAKSELKRLLDKTR